MARKAQILSEHLLKQGTWAEGLEEIWVMALERVTQEVTLPEEAPLKQRTRRDKASEGFD
jgi:hypothetical protein